MRILNLLTWLLGYYIFHLEVKPWSAQVSASPWLNMTPSNSELMGTHTPPNETYERPYSTLDELILPWVLQRTSTPSPVETADGFTTAAPNSTLPSRHEVAKDQQTATASFNIKSHGRTISDFMKINNARKMAPAAVVTNSKIEIQEPTRSASRNILEKRSAPSIIASNTPTRKKGSVLDNVSRASKSRHSSSSDHDGLNKHQVNTMVTSVKETHAPTDLDRGTAQSTNITSTTARKGVKDPVPITEDGENGNPATERVLGSSASVYFEENS